MNGYRVHGEGAVFDEHGPGLGGVVARLFFQQLARVDEIGQVYRQVETEPGAADEEGQAATQRRPDVGRLEFDAEEAKPPPSPFKAPRQSFGLDLFRISDRRLGQHLSRMHLLPSTASDHDSVPSFGAAIYTTIYTAGRGGRRGSFDVSL